MHSYAVHVVCHRYVSTLLYLLLYVTEELQINKYLRSYHGRYLLCFMLWKCFLGIIKPPIIDISRHNRTVHCNRWIHQCQFTCGSGSLFCLLLGESTDYAQPITCLVTEVTCPVIGRAQPQLTLSKRQKTGPGVWIECTHPAQFAEDGPVDILNFVSTQRVKEKWTLMMIFNMNW